jgi:hypothetical protein
MRTATKISPTIHSQRGIRRGWREVTAGARSISTLLLLQFCCLLSGQTWDAGPGTLKLGIEQRFRYEDREGNTFGRDVDTLDGLWRTRVSLTYETDIVKFSGTMQDARAPWYGLPAPAGLRDEHDLHEAYVQLFPNHKTGFSLVAGRLMLNYGEGRLIGSPQWSNTSRTYDHAHVSYGTKRARIEALFVSPVKVRTDDFNWPVLGERIWGVYNTFSELPRQTAADAYFLRHDQNRIGGFTGGSRTTGTDRLGVNVLGFRFLGPLADGWKFSVEGVAETGHVGPSRQRAAGWFSGVSRRWTILARALDFSAEYKYASPTFDQVSPANHDKFGHEDLLGWRNMHNLRSLTSYAIAKPLTVNFMYNHLWLASACEALYNSAGRAISRSSSCSAGRHVGQETDVFGVYRHKHLQFGAGIGYFFPGAFVRITTPGRGSTYVYVFQGFTL